MSIERDGRDPDEVLLVEFLTEGTSDVTKTLKRLLSELSVPPGNQEMYRAVSEPRVTVYLRGRGYSTRIEEVKALVRERLGEDSDGDVEASRLAVVHAFAGPSAAERPMYHYVVRTDVEPGGERELEQWYDEEHMPALASVPGVVLAQRMISLDAAPRYYACYDLMRPDVREDPRWLAARNTTWSHRVRVTFRNTRRITSRRLIGPGP